MKCISTKKCKWETILRSGRTLPRSWRSNSWRWSKIRKPTAIRRTTIRREIRLRERWRSKLFRRIKWPDIRIRWEGEVRRRSRKRRWWRSFRRGFLAWRRSSFRSRKPSIRNILRQPLSVQAEGFEGIRRGIRRDKENCSHRCRWKELPKLNYEIKLNLNIL